MRWLFREITIYFSLLTISPPHQLKSYVIVHEMTNKTAEVCNGVAMYLLLARIIGGWRLLYFGGLGLNESPLLAAVVFSKKKKSSSWCVGVMLDVMRRLSSWASLLLGGLMACIDWVENFGGLSTELWGVFESGCVRRPIVSQLWARLVEAPFSY